MSQVTRHQAAASNFCPADHLRITRASNGFTLVEMLVVISITALLIAMLLPALSQAQASGRNVRCLSNLRQVGLSCNGYMVSNNGCLPGWIWADKYRDYTMPDGVTTYTTGSSTSAPWLRYQIDNGYIEGILKPDNAALKESPATTCPEFWFAGLRSMNPTGSLYSWGGSINNMGWTAYKRGGTYSFNYSLDITMTDATGKKLKQLDRIKDINKRFLIGEGISGQSRVACASDTAANGGSLDVRMWFGHFTGGGNGSLSSSTNPNVGFYSGNTNLLYYDGRAESRGIQGLQQSTSWPVQTAGSDSPWARPW